MKIDQPLALLAGLTPEQFMARHWQKTPLLVRQALPGFSALVPRSRLFQLAQREEVASRLVHQPTPGDWQLKRGPFGPRGLPGLKTPNWTLLVQSVDQHDLQIRQLLDQFRFVSDARLDDLMISYATSGGGVGPHYDSYDVLLLQAHGTRRWQIGRQKSLALKDDLPLKILRRFTPEQTFDLYPGDMLYLPPHYAHDGVALNECMTYSIGFRAPGRQEIGSHLLGRLAETLTEELADTDQADAPFADPHRAATTHPAQIPPDLAQFAADAIQNAVKNKGMVSRVLGEYLTEPGPQVWFEPGQTSAMPSGVRLDRRSKMMYDGNQVFINGECLTGSGADLRLMRKLANQRYLSAKDCAKASAAVLEQLQQWCESGWLVREPLQNPMRDLRPR
jgi:50S ribosomal protein L16 3-hydroxylase